MYTPTAFAMSKDESYQFVQENGFGALVSKSLNGTHLPFLLQREEGEKGCLYTHFARANPHWQELDGEQVVILFSGPHGYISPRWYRTRPAVPTWNYVAVHVYGVVRLLTSSETLSALEATIAHYDPTLSEEKGIITDEFRDKLLKGIVGVAIDITRIEGKQKLSQNRSAEDLEGVVIGLESSNAEPKTNLSEWMMSKTRK